MSTISKSLNTPNLEADLRRLHRMVRKSRGVIVAGHVNPDGDDIACQLALGEYLQALGKPFCIAAEEETPRSFTFLPQSGLIRRVRPGLFEGGSYDLLIVVDSGDFDRIGNVQKHLPQGLTVVNIDHHRGNTRFGNLNIVVEKACSIGEILYYFFRENRIPLTKTLAEYLYVSVVTDTGSFRYDCMHREVHEIAADLLAKGIVPADYNIHLHMNKSLAYMKLLTRTLEKMALFENGKIAVSVLTPEDFDGAGEDETDGLIEYLGMLDSVSVYVLIKIKKSPNGQLSASLRSKYNVDVARIAQSFGGGGHMRAAGCKTDTTDLAGFQNALLARIREQL